MACESVAVEEEQETAEIGNRLDLSGYQIVRAQYFSTAYDPAMTISNGKLRFNAACLKKFVDVEYVELLLNTVNHCIAIRPCKKENPNAIRWGRLKEGRWCASSVSCKGLAKTLFDILEWEEGMRYRFRGEYIENGDSKLMMFELDAPEMIKVEEVVLPPKEPEAEDGTDETAEPKTVKKTILIYPPHWAGSYGRPITSLASVSLLTQVHYAGDWDILRPAAEVNKVHCCSHRSHLLLEKVKSRESSQLINA